MIIKACINDFKDKSILHPLIRDSKASTIVTLDYRNRCRSSIYTPIKFVNKIIFVNQNSFIQTNSFLGHQLRKYVLKLINEKTTTKTKDIVCIGGESYNYLFFSHIDSGIFYTNNKIIYDDFQFNQKFYSKKIIGKVIDYNKEIFSPPGNFKIIILNLAKLNLHLMKIINQHNYSFLIIINCHHHDFWKKIKYLTHYKIKSRKYFIDNKTKYFLTVTLFQQIRKTT